MNPAIWSGCAVISTTRGVDRAAIADESGNIRYALKTAYRDSTTHVLFEPLDLIARQARWGCGQDSIGAACSHEPRAQRLMRVFRIDKETCRGGVTEKSEKQDLQMTTSEFDECLRLAAISTCRVRIPNQAAAGS